MGWVSRVSSSKVIRSSAAREGCVHASGAKAQKKIAISRSAIVYATHTHLTGGDDISGRRADHWNRAKSTGTATAMLRPGHRLITCPHCHAPTAHGLPLVRGLARAAKGPHKPRGWRTC